MKTVISLIAFFLALVAHAQTNSARVIAGCRSVALEPASAYAPGAGFINVYFTTYDGGTGTPRYQPLQDGTLLFSDELRPRQARPGVYESDYIIFDSTDSAIQSGSFTLTLPTTDLDQNSLPDVLQKRFPGNVVVSGGGRSDMPQVVPFVLHGQLYRSAGSVSGTYVIKSTTSGAGGTTIRYTGKFRLPSIEGTAEYIVGSPNQISFSLTSLNPENGDTTLTGSTTYTIANVNQLQLAEFTLTSDTGELTFVPASTFNRVGRRYIGKLALPDGAPDTYWPDYKKWVVEIRDRNDADADGIPDLTDQ